MYKIIKSNERCKYNFQQEYLSKEAAFNALKKGQVDYVAAHVCPHYFQELQHLPKITFVLHPVNGFYYITFNCRKKPFSDINFRKAIAYVVNRQFMCNNVLLGLGKPLYTPVPHESYWYNPNTIKYGEKLNFADISERQNKAKEILTNSGYSWDKNNMLTFNDEPIAEMKINTPIPEYDCRRMSEGNILTYWLRDIGIPATAQPTPPVELTKLTFTHDFDLLFGGFWLPQPLDPDYLAGFFHSSQAEQGGLNCSGYMNPEFDKLAIMQREEIDTERRKDLVWKMQEILATDVPWLPLYSINRIDTYRNDAFIGWISRPKGFPPYYQIWSFLNIRKVKKKPGKD